MSYTDKDVLHNSNLKEILNGFIREINSNNGMKILGDPNLTYGSSAPAKIKNSEFSVIRNGVISTIDSAETALTATDHDIADGYGAIFLVYLDEDNDIVIEKGDAILAGTNAVCPATPEGGLKVGEVKVVMSGGAFTAGTTSLNDGVGLTGTFTDKTDSPPDVDDYEPKHWMHHSNLKDVFSAMDSTLIDEVRFLSNPTIAIGTSSKAKVKHGDITYVKNGAITTIAGGEVAFTSTDHDIPNKEASVQEATFLVYLDGSDVKLLMGDIATGAGESVAPALPAGKIRLGEVVIPVDAGSADGTAPFVAGTTLLDADLLGTVVFTTTVDVEGDDFSLTLAQKNYLYSQNLLTLFEDVIDALNANNNNEILGNPTFARGSNTARIAHGAFSVLRDGEMVNVGAESTGVALTATTHNLADGMGAVYSIYLDASNVVKIVMGTAVAGGTGAVAPAIPEGGMKVGEVKIVNASGSAFVANTTALNAGGITTTFVNKIEVFEEIV